MKRRYHVSFGFSTPAGYDRAAELLTLIGEGQLAERKPNAGYTFLYDEGDARLAALLPELEVSRQVRREGFSSFVREERTYTHQELAEVELLRLIVRAYAGSGADRYGTVFDETRGCPTCGAGLAQASELIIDKREMGKKDIAVTYEFEYVISDRLAHALREQRISGAEWRPVRHRTTKMRDEPRLWQIIPTHTLPPMSPPTEFFRSPRYCQACGRSGLFLRRHVPGVDIAEAEIFYRREDLAVTGWRDVNRTYEAFGETRFAKPLIIISQPAYQLLKTHKVRSVAVEPVHIQE